MADPDKFAPVVFLRDVDGTGSLHPCLKGDPGAIAYVPVDTEDDVDGVDLWPTRQNVPDFEGAKRCLTFSLAGQT